jgi:hypothetical protein
MSREGIPEPPGQESRPREPAMGHGGSSPAGLPWAEAQVPGGVVCEICGTIMYDRHCKVLCPRCGYQRDCSDP